MIENIWQNDAFSMFELSNAVVELPSKPGLVLGSGLFTPSPIVSTVAVLENKNGVLGLVPNTERGAAGVINAPQKRQVRAFPLMHLPENESVKADDVQGIRAFGSTTELQQVSAVVNEKLQEMKANIEVTREHAMVTALQGEILDADGTTVIADLWTAYGISETSIDFALGTAGTNVRGQALEVKRAIEASLGAAGYSNVEVLCSDSFFDAFINHDNVKAAYANWQSNEQMRNDPRAGFEFGGCIWRNYDPKVGVYSFIPDGTARAFPTGTLGIFKEFLGPADYTETVNTLGLEFYARQEPQKFNKGTDLECQSNPLAMCTRPGVLINCMTSD